LSALRASGRLMRNSTTPSAGRSRSTRSVILRTHALGDMVKRDMVSDMV
jgi:hypothetical protein